MARAYRFTTHIPGFEVWIEYQTGNLRIQSASWEVPDGVTARAYVWENGVLRIDQVLVGVGSTNIAGSYRLVEGVDDSGEAVLFLPPELDYRFECS